MMMMIVIVITVMMNDGNNNDNSDYCLCTCTLSMVSLIEKKKMSPKTEMLKDSYLVALFHVLIVLSIAVADLKAVVSCSD